VNAAWADRARCPLIYTLSGRESQFPCPLTRRAIDQIGNDMAVTWGEFGILKTFAENPDRPLSRDWLLETTSHRSRDPFDRAIDLRITRIRRKIEPTPEKPTVIRTVRGVGYMFVPPAE
jgi:DNA-binding response OmpR family regulator